MVLAGYSLSLIIYLAQQLGVILAVGAEVVVLVLYLSSINKTLHPAHPHARFAQYAGLVLIILSGIGAVALHLNAQQLATLEAPAFGFKWLLIAALSIWALLRVDARAAGWRAHELYGFVGAMWFALFLVHTIAPVTTWIYLLVAYVAWTVLFMVVWSACVYLLLPKRVLKKVFLEPKIIKAPPVAGLPEVARAELAAPHIIIPTPAPAPVHHIPAPVPAPPPAAVLAVKDDELPAIRVMPRTPNELAEQNRGASVQFS